MSLMQSMMRSRQSKNSEKRQWEKLTECMCCNSHVKHGQHRQQNDAKEETEEEEKEERNWEDKIKSNQFANSKEKLVSAHNFKISLLCCHPCQLCPQEWSGLSNKGLPLPNRKEKAVRCIKSQSRANRKSRCKTASASKLKGTGCQQDLGTSLSSVCCTNRLLVTL